MNVGIVLSLELICRYWFIADIHYYVIVTWRDIIVLRSVVTSVGHYYHTVFYVVITGIARRAALLRRWLSCLPHRLPRHEERHCNSALLF